MTSKNAKDQYFVAVKVFVINRKNELLITKDRFGDWDIPGGRLREIDFKVPLEKVVARKVKEELGNGFKIRLGETKVFMRHQRNEILPNGKREARRIFAIGYSAKYVSGSIELGKSHETYLWINLKTLKPEKYFHGGWLIGIREFKKLSIIN